LHAVQREEARHSGGNDVEKSLRVLQEELDYLKLSLSKN
jgi:hypothetical protein